MDITCTLAQVTDMETCMQFMREYCAFDHLPFEEEARRRTFQQVQEDNTLGRLWLIIQEGTPIGYLAVTLGFSFEYGGRDAFIDEVYIRETYRGQGIGKHVLDFAEEQSRALGVRALHLEVERENVSAHNLYRKVGFLDHDRYLLTKYLAVHR